MSDSLWPHALQPARLACLSLSPGVCSNLCPLSQWCLPTISSSVVPFSSCPQSFPALVFWLFTSGGQSIGVSILASVLPMNIQSWFPLELSCLVSLKSKGLSRVFSNTTVQKHWFFWCSAFFMVQLSHLYMITGKTIALTIWTFVGKVLFLLFHTLSRFVTAFLTRSRCLLISWLQSLSAIILEPKKVKSVTVSTFSPICLPWNDGTGCHDLSFLNVEF